MKLVSTLLCNNIRSLIDTRNIVGAVFIDLTKAFDTVGQGVLLGKLHTYRVRGMEKQWITNYLFNREQYVCLDGTYSTKQTLLSGVPQRFHSWIVAIHTLLFYDFNDSLMTE